MEWLYPGILIPVWLPKLWCHTLKTFLVGKLLVWKYNQNLRKIFGKRSKCFVIPTICHLLSFFDILTTKNGFVPVRSWRISTSRLSFFDSTVMTGWTRSAWSSLQILFHNGRSVNRRRIIFHHHIISWWSRCMPLFSGHFLLCFTF